MNAKSAVVGWAPTAIGGLRKGRPDSTLVEVRLMHCTARAFTLEWDTRSAGWGTTTFRKMGGGLACDHDAMGRAFTTSLLQKFVAERPTEEWPDLLLQYDAGRGGGPC